MFTPSPSSALRPDDLAACRKLLRGGSRSFFSAAHLLPRSVAAPASALYAFCRLADDAIDVAGGRGAALAQLRDMLDRAYAGRPHDCSAERAFTAVISAYAIPRALPDALLEGLAWDVQGKRYETIDDVLAYAVRVAGAVGAMMAILMGRRDHDALARACDLGVAMQLTNIARDVGEDARAGRLYLPRTWLLEAGIDPEQWITRPHFRHELGMVVARLLALADDLYARADSGIALLPAACRPGIVAARLIYAAIGDEIARANHDSVSRRAMVSGRRKLALALRALAASTLPVRETCAAPALPEALWLLHAAATHRHEGGNAQMTRRRFGERLAGIVDLFERLARAEQVQRERP